MKRVIGGTSGPSSRLVRWVPRLVCVFLFAIVAPAAGETPDLEGNPFRGRELLSSKLCLQCHSVWGHGAELAPDISRIVIGKSMLDLVGDFWNHTPAMIESMSGRGYPWPTLDRPEMGDLLSYLYYLRLFDEPGDAARGSVAYSQLQCSSCHSLGRQGGAPGTALDRFSAYPSPVMLAQAMWNAGPVMQRAQLSRGDTIPKFSGDEMADIQAHIRAQALREDRGVELLPLPDPAKGASVFRGKRCDACHGSARGGAPDLGAQVMQMTVSEMSGVLWNHSYAMNGVMRSRGIPFPRFQGTEMADLISYLRFLSFFELGGEPRRGEAVFREKGCSRCHGQEGALAADLTASRLTRDPVAFSTAMWNHAPEMHRKMDEQAVAWPKFEKGDMGDLAAWLRSVETHGGDTSE